MDDSLFTKFCLAHDLLFKDDIQYDLSTLADDL